MTRCARCCTTDVTVAAIDVHHEDGTITRGAPLCSTCAAQDRRKGVVTMASLRGARRVGRYAGRHV